MMFTSGVIVAGMGRSAVSASSLSAWRSGGTDPSVQVTCLRAGLTTQDKTQDNKMLASAPMSDRKSYNGDYGKYCSKYSPAAKS
jgi:hypothetical protein